MKKLIKKLNKRARMASAKAVLIAAVIMVIGWILQANFQLVVNRSESLPIRSVLVLKGKIPNKIDQIFVFRVKNNPHYPNQEKEFIKLVGGFAGDQIKIQDREVYVSEKMIGVAKAESLKGLPLTMIDTGTIPPHKFFAYTPHKDSLDSRYQDLGLVDEKDIIGTAIATF
jgi:conjugal transfer pilin signal peptidase TrbI